MGKQNHHFITFYNPRNGRVTIQACAYCGIAKGLELATKVCRNMPMSENKMYKAGWQTSIHAVAA